MKEQLKTILDKFKKEFQEAIKRYGRQRIITSLYVIFSLIAITVFGLFAIGPTLTTISELHKEKEDGELTLEQLQIKNQSLQRLSSQYQQIESDLDAVYLAIPTSPRIPELTRKIELIANRNNLSIQNLTTGAIELYPAARTVSPLFSYNITITTLGTENDINNFIQEFISFDRLISIDRITSGTAERDLFTATITGRAYFLKE